MAEAIGRRSSGPVSPDGPLTVAAAMDAAEELAGTRYYSERVTLSDEAVDAGRRFRQYSSPGELPRALQAMMRSALVEHGGEHYLGTRR